MSSWATAGVTVFGEKLLWTDLLGNVFSLVTVLLAIRRTIWTWPVQLAGAVLLFAASVSTHAPGNALKQLMFFGLVSYGWVRWLRGVKESQGLPVRPATARERTVLEGHVERVVGPLAAGSFVSGPATATRAIVSTLLPNPDEGWSDKIRRSGLAIRNASLRRSDHLQEPPFR